jgi:hypothetical protein
LVSHCNNDKANAPQCYVEHYLLTGVCLICRESHKYTIEFIVNLSVEQAYNKNRSSEHRWGRAVQ